MDVEAVADIFGRLDRELWLITAQAGERRSGLIATYVARVSLVPSLPRVTIGWRSITSRTDLIEASNAFAMHLIAEEQIDWVWRFGVPSGRKVDKFDRLAMSAGASGADLTDAIAWMDCAMNHAWTRAIGRFFSRRCLMQPAAGLPLTFKRMLELVRGGAVARAETGDGA